jgi:hypothetical protein
LIAVQGTDTNDRYASLTAKAVSPAGKRQGFTLPEKGRGLVATLAVAATPDHIADVNAIVERTLDHWLSAPVLLRSPAL